MGYAKQQTWWDKSLLTVSVLACISHGKSARSGMLELEILIIEAVTVNGLDGFGK